MSDAAADPHGVLTADDLFPGEGEMSALLRAQDWARSPLGPIDRWTPALRTVVGLVLGSRFPMLLWWGPELLQVYNDAYRPILGDKHPKALGARGADVWSEIWHILGPMAESVLSGEPATWAEHLLLPMNRKGFLEETYFTFSYSPVPADDQGSAGRGRPVGGVLVTCQETTAQVLGARRLETLQRIAPISAQTSRSEEAATLAVRALGDNPNDLPFALLYRSRSARTGPGREALTVELVGSVGLAAGVEPPRQVVVGAEGEPWPFAEARRTRRPVDASLGGWDPAACVAPGRPPVGGVLVLPVVTDGAREGFLVVGVSAALELDEVYRSFLSLVAGHVTAALSSVEAYEEERRRAEALAALDEAKTAFFANVSHEFRTPLTLMLGPLEEALEPGADLPGAQRVRVEAAYRNARRLLKLVNALLAFARLEAGRAQAHYRPTDLARGSTDLASTFRSLVESAGLRFEVEAAPLSEPVWVDAEMWEQIVLNLLSNAFKFTFEGAIRVRIGRGDGDAIFEVEDTGVGIPEAELPRLFDRFHRVEGSRGRTFEGSGIGLALVRELVHQHGGSVEVTSREGVGTRFTVRVPFGVAHLAKERLDPRPVDAVELGHAAAWLEEAADWTGSAPPEVEPEAGISLTSPGARTPRVPGHILIADDNRDMRAYLSRLLASQGWAVEAVADGHAALAAARSRPPDLVLTDVMMPGMDGYELLRELRANPRTRDVSAILVSARAGEESVIEGLGAGSDDYLVKPFSARELLARVEGQLARSQLRAAEARHREHMLNLFRHAPVGIAVVRGPQHVFELANPLYTELVGERPLLGLTVREAFPELDGQNIYEMLDAVYATGRPSHGRALRMELMRASPDTGEERLEEVFFDYVYQPIPGRDGSIEGIMAVAFETTELEKARRSAEKANRAKDDFLAMLAHELRNPMAAIGSALGVLARSAPGDAARRERACRTAQRQLGHLDRIVDDLLDLSRISRGHVTLERQPAELEQLVRHAVAAVTPAIESRQHRLTMTCEGGPFPVNADVTRVEQIVTNLLTNACKYTDPGGAITVSLTREAGEAGDVAVLRVTDTGRGLAPEMVGHVFEEFVQVERGLDRAGGGLGLGLAVVKRLAEMHGGSVAAASEGLGCGAEFTVRLPLDATVGMPDGAEEPRAEARPERRVLLVEDNADVRETLLDVIEDLGYAVDAAVDGPQGLEKAVAGGHDIALVDVGLPGIDGYEVARGIRAAPEGDRLVLVALTGYGGPEATARAAEAGFDLHLTKPIDLTRLMEVLTLERKRTG